MPAADGQLYITIGRWYGRYRRPDPRIAAAIAAALGDADGFLAGGADGFLGAYWRPEAYLDAGVRGAIDLGYRVLVAERAR